MIDMHGYVTLGCNLIRYMGIGYIRVSAAAAAAAYLTCAGTGWLCACVPAACCKYVCRLHVPNKCR